MWFWLAACTPETGTVQMNGLVHDAPESAGDLVSGVALSVVDAAGEVFGETVTGEDGSFSIGTPAGQAFYLELTAEGFVPTAFSGTAGLSDFSAGEGYPWIAPPAWVDTVREDFSACPVAQNGGGVVAGDVRLYVAGITDLATLPPVGSGQVTVYPEGTNLGVEACYQDDSGLSVADGEDTGQGGRFAVFGVPPGPIIVEVVFEDGDGMYPSVLYSFVMPDEGFVPMYPALVAEGDL